MAKKTYTYATDPKVHKKATAKAKKNKSTLSETIDFLLRRFIEPIPIDKGKCMSLPNDYFNFKNIEILNADGTITPLSPIPPHTPTKKGNS